MKPEALEPSVSTMQSTSSPFPNLDKQHMKKNRYPVRQLRASHRVSSPQSESREPNNTRRSVSAGAVLCSNSQQGFLNNLQNPSDTRNSGFHDKEDYPPYNTLAGNFKAPPNYVHGKHILPPLPPIGLNPHQNYAPTRNYFNPSVEYPLWLGPPVNETPMGVKVTAHGFISLQLPSDVRVDITLDQAIRCISNSKGMIVSLSSDGSRSAFIHPIGKIYQYGNRVEISTSDSHGNTKYAKMWQKGISFTSQHSALVYLLDSAGPRTVTDCFSDLQADYSVPVFLEESKHGPCYVPDCVRQIQNAEYWMSNEGTSNWAVNGIRISQSPDGLVRVARGASKYIFRISSPSQSASLTTPNVHATITSVPYPRNHHVFVKRGEKRMHCDGSAFIVRNGTHAAGFDETSQFKVY